jgi:hypothetical protein
MKDSDFKKMLFNECVDNLASNGRNAADAGGTQTTDTQLTHAAIVLAQNYMAPFSYGSTIRQVMEGFIVWLDEQQQHA